MNNSLNKITPNNEYEFENQYLNQIKSKICINSENLRQPRRTNENEFALLKNFEEKIAKKAEMDRNHPCNLEIVLWNKSRSKKILNFECSSGNGKVLSANDQNCFGLSKNMKKSHMKNNLKQVGNVKIQIYQMPNGENSFKFSFETLDSSTVHSKLSGKNEEINWKGGKDALKFKINLNQNPTGAQPKFKVPDSNRGKENVLASPPMPTTNQFLTPSPKS